jgi:hypothetical protein
MLSFIRNTSIRLRVVTVLFLVLAFLTLGSAGVFSSGSSTPAHASTAQAWTPPGSGGTIIRACHPPNGLVLGSVNSPSVLQCQTPTTTTTTQPTTTTTTSPTTTTTTQPSGGTCTAANVVWSSSDAQAAHNFDGGNELWWVGNDAWNGSHGPQTINACSASSWYVTSDQTNNQGQVETYPDTEYDVGGRNAQSQEPISGYTSMMSTFNESFPASGWSGDAGYDLWTNNWQHETMIWNDVRGTQTYWSNCAEPGPDFNACGLANAPVAVTLDGVPYHFFSYGAKGSGAEEVFVRDTFVTSGSVDILAAYNWEVANGWASASQNPTQEEYGTEIAATTGTQTFPVNDVTFTNS